MDKKVKKKVLQRLNKIEKEFAVILLESSYDDLSDIDETKIYSLITKIKTAIIDITGKNSEYYNHMLDVDKNQAVGFLKIKYWMGIINGLVFNIKNDYLANVSELIHASLFSDFLDMGEHLLSEGYKDAAAVITGSTLEGHLKKLAQKSGISIEYTEFKGKKRSKNADRINADLTKSKVYSANDQKQVTAWLGIRNSAAHGKYDEYNSNQVELMTKGIRLFISSYKA